MKTTNATTQFSFQELNLSVGERAMCHAGHPRISTVIVECIKDFNYDDDLYGHESSVILDNASSYVKVIDNGLIGLSTSHLISNNWKKL